MILLQQSSGLVQLSTHTHLQSLFMIRTPFLIQNKLMLLTNLVYLSQSVTHTISVVNKLESMWQDAALA